VTRAQVGLSVNVVPVRFGTSS